MSTGPEAANKTVDEDILSFSALTRGDQRVLETENPDARRVAEIGDELVSRGVGSGGLLQLREIPVELADHTGLLLRHIDGEDAQYAVATRFVEALFLLRSYLSPSNPAHKNRGLVFSHRIQHPHDVICPMPVPDHDLIIRLR